MNFGTNFIQQEFQKKQKRTDICVATRQRDESATFAD